MVLTELMVAGGALAMGGKVYQKRQRKQQVARFLREPAHSHLNGNGSAPGADRTPAPSRFTNGSGELGEEVAEAVASLYSELQSLLRTVQAEARASFDQDLKPLFDEHGRELGGEIVAVVSVVVDEVKEAYHSLRPEGHTTLQGNELRRQQLREIATDADAQRVSAAEQEANRNLVIAVGAVGAALSGIVLYPPLALLSAPAIFYTMAPVFKKTYKMLKKGQVGVDTLSAITITGCLLLQYFTVGSTLNVVYCASRKLLLKVQDDSRKNLIDVFRQQPRTVWVLVAGSEVEMPFEQLKVGDIVVVDAGMTVPADGTIVEGIASIDQHILTGEAQPAEKSVGDEVFASTVVLSGRICFKVEQAGRETIAAKIGEMLNNTADFKTHTQLQAEQMADKTAVPTLVIGALSIPVVGAYGALAILNAHFKYRLGIVAPIGILNFLNMASQHGVLIKDGRTLDLLNQVDTIVFDKTGTLTKEVPHVGAVYTADGHDEETVLTLAAAAEHRQTHPIARAIQQAAKDRQLPLPAIDEAEYKMGYGLTVHIGEQLVQVGSARFMEMAGIDVPAMFTAVKDRCHEQGHSLVMVAVDRQLAGAIELRPTLRPEIKSVIAQLRQRPNIQSMYIISGDHETPTRRLAHELGIDHYFAETLPENKADLIGELQRQGKFVCYVGDGINDSIALKKSQVSVSLRGASTAATDTAQVVLMDASLHQLPFLFDLAAQFDTNMRTGFMCLLVPTVIGIGGVFLFQFGLIHTMVLTTVGLTAGVVNAMKPWIQHKQEIVAASQQGVLQRPAFGAPPQIPVSAEARSS